MKRSCKKVRKNLMPFLTHQLEEERAREIEQHMKHCSLCRKEEEELRLTWDLLGRLPMDREFPDLSDGILDYVIRERQRASIFQRFVEKMTLIPAPVLSLLIFFLSIPPGALLGKNLYFALSGSYQPSLREMQLVYANDMPLDVFADFPEQSLGRIYVNLLPESSEEE